MLLVVPSLLFLLLQYIYSWRNQYMYGLKYSKSKDQLGKVANPARGQPNRKNEYSLVYISRLRTWSRETGSAVPSRVSLR